MIKRLIIYLRQLLKELEEIDIPEPVNDYGRGEMFTPKWGIIVPHEKSKRGARTHSSVQPPVYEYDYGLTLGDFLSDKLPYKTRDTGGVYQAAKDLITLGCDATIEPHLNAYNGKAHGYEILVLAGDSLSKEYALNIISSYEAKYPERRKRQGDGIKEIKKGDRGYYNLKNSKNAGAKIAILTELFFIDNPDEYMEPIEMSNFLREVLIVD
jgi:hypothetical protein